MTTRIDTRPSELLTLARRGRLDPTAVDRLLGPTAPSALLDGLLDHVVALLTARYGTPGRLHEVLVRRIADMPSDSARPAQLLAQRLRGGPRGRSYRIGTDDRVALIVAVARIAVNLARDAAEARVTTR